MKGLILGLLLISSNVFAVSVEFKFDINSSAPSIYPCDAGLKHENHSQRVCYDRVTFDSCNPGNCVSEVDCNCVCTGDSESNAGEIRHDFMSVSHADWTDNGDRVGTITKESIAAGSTKFERVFDSKNEWNKQLTSLSFNFGSERYGAEFYLDVCYRGPQIEYYEAGQPLDTPNFSLKAQATATDINTGNGLVYTKLADLKVKAITVCDQQGKGSYVYASNDNALEHDITTNMTVGSGQFVAANAAYTGFNTGSNLYLLDQWINVGNTFAPRFCKTRYYFKENIRESSNLIKTLRKWKKQKARVCTYTSINEGVQ